MNIALLFSFTKQIVADLAAEREAHAETRTKAEAERQQLIDAFARASNKPAVFTRPAAPNTQPVVMAFGPTAINAKHYQNRESEQRAIDTPPTPEEIAAAAQKIHAGGR